VFGHVPLFVLTQSLSVVPEKIAQMQIASGALFPPPAAAAASPSSAPAAAAASHHDHTLFPPGETGPSPDESCMQPLCEVVHILTRTLARKLIVGIVVPPPTPSAPLLLRPLDARLPPFTIDPAPLPALLSASSCHVTSALLSATFLDWPHTHQRPHAQLQVPPTSTPFPTLFRFTIPPGCSR